MKQDLLTSPSESSSTPDPRPREPTTAPWRRSPPSPSCATTPPLTSTNSRMLSKRSEKPPKQPSLFWLRRSTPTVLRSEEDVWRQPRLFARWGRGLFFLFLKGGSCYFISKIGTFGDCKDCSQGERGDFFFFFSEGPNSGKLKSISLSYLMQFL